MTMPFSRSAQIVGRTTMVMVAAIAPVLIIYFGDSHYSLALGASRVTAWSICLIGMVLLFVSAGLQMRGRVLGVLIDERNRYSLSRLQITLWTLLTMSILYAVYVSNILRATAAQSPLTVGIDPNLIVLMGFSVATFVTAPMALSRKTDRPTDEDQLVRNAVDLKQQQALAATPGAAGSVLVKQEPADARLADFIRGEEAANMMTVDLPRLQMLLITLVVIALVGATLVKFLYTQGAFIEKLPAIDQTLTLLVLVSHAGYVGGKLIPNTASITSGLSGADLARTLRASQDAGALATDLQFQLQRAAPDDPRQTWLRSTATMAQSLAAEAASILSKTESTTLSADIVKIEGQVAALRAIVQVQPSGPSARKVLDAPSLEVVRRLQLRLSATYPDVNATGIVDATTEDALQKTLDAMGIARNMLSSRPYRFYEEALDLMQ